VFYKGVPNKKIRTVTLRVKGHTIFYLGEQIEKGSGESTFRGELIMNVINLRIGSGIHYHDTYEGYNFPRAYIKDKDTIYIETSYLSKNNQTTEENFSQIYQAYVFKRNKEY
jgi:hypothetical protein